MINTSITESRQQLRGLHRHNGAPLHACATAEAELAQYDYRSGQQVDAGEIAAVAPDCDQSAPHSVTRLVADVTMHDDLTAAHADRTAAIRSAHHVPHI